MTEKSERPAAVHDGHRKRLRERFRREGLDGFAQHEVLELLLCYGRARGDVNPLAHELINSFGSLRGVLEATPEQLMRVKGVGEETATLIGLMLPLFRNYSALVNDDVKAIRSRDDARRYCLALFAGKRTEEFFVVCMNAACQVLGHRKIAYGSLTEVPVHPRLVAETVLNFNAHSVLLCHNHPGGSPQPSQCDVETTKLLNVMLASMGVTLLDHLVVAGEESCSMVQSGYIGLDDGVDFPGRKPAGSK